MGYVANDLTDFHILSNKAGIIVSSCSVRSSRCVIKYFDDIEQAREVKHYQRLNQAGIQTLPLVGTTDRAILMEDVNHHSEYRLGTAQDLENKDVITHLARWYRHLHDKTSRYIEKSMYCELDYLNLEVIEGLDKKFHSRDADLWILLKDSMEALRKVIDSLDYTLTYNDFYWTNMMVERHNQQVFMFDYNLMGKGYRYGDIRNVCSNLSDEMGKVFKACYGDYDIREEAVDRVVSDIVTLHFGTQQGELPSWAKDSLSRIEDGTVKAALKQLIQG